MLTNNANNILYAYEWRERALRTGDGIFASTICYWIILCELMVLPRFVSHYEVARDITKGHSADDYAQLKRFM